MYLPETITTNEDLRIVAMALKTLGEPVPIMGYTMKNGRRFERMYCMAYANEAGDDIQLETRNTRECLIDISTIYPQLIAGLHARLITA